MTGDWTTTPPAYPAADPDAAARGADADDPSDSPAHEALRALIDASDAAALVFAFDGSVIDSNSAGRVLFRGPDASHPGGRLPMSDIIDQLPERLLADPVGGVWRGEISPGGGDGPGATYAVAVVVRHAAGTRNDGFIAVLARDITEQVNRAAALTHAIEHDSTTGLLTRTAMLERIAASLAAGRRDLAVLMVDIDALGEINAALGHAAGDRVLISTANRLASAVRPVDAVARLGSDELAVLCHDIDDPSSAEELAQRVRRVLTGRVGMSELELEVSVSIGVAVVDSALDAVLAGSGGARQAAAGLLAFADAGLHAAKRAGRARVVLSTPDLRAEARQRTKLAAELHHALRAGQLSLEYQPIFSAVSEKAEAAEALLRWDHPTRGRLEAYEFVGLAEETGVLVPIGDWVLGSALSATRRWTDAGVVDDRFGVHVNVSRLQLSDPGFVNRVVDLLGVHRLKPRQLVIEAREATLLGDADAAVRTVRALRRLGVRVALDNFGTGHNALSLLTEIGADVLKLDGSLALPTGASEADTRVVRALVMLAHALDMEVVAERVTGVEQLRRLRAAGCDLVQGHLVGMPAPAERFR
jgi:diguanylate cyclase (GGDEF)-like protein